MNGYTFEYLSVSKADINQYETNISGQFWTLSRAYRPQLTHLTLEVLGMHNSPHNVFNSPQWLCKRKGVDQLEERNFFDCRVGSLLGVCLAPQIANLDAMLYTVLRRNWSFSQITIKVVKLEAAMQRAPNSHQCWRCNSILSTTKMLLVLINDKLEG